MKQFLYLKENTKIGKCTCVCLIVLVNIFFSLNYFANTFPASEGWFVNYAELFIRGKVPYRDFYYYVPPLNLLLDVAFWKMSFGYWLAYRGWYLAERILIYILVFKLLNKFYDYKVSAVACMFAEILCTADEFDYFGDYNQNAMLLTVLIAYAAVAFARDSVLRNKLYHLFIAGFILGLMFLCKQTIFFSAGMGFFLILTVLCISKRDKGYWVYCFSTAIGMLVPMLICFIYLQRNGAVSAFIDQLFVSVNGKGSIIDILLKSPLKPMTDLRGWSLAFLLYAVLMLIDSEKENEKTGKALVALILATSLAILSYIPIKGYVKAYVTAWKCGLLVTVTFTLMVVIWIAGKRWMWAKKALLGVKLFSVIAIMIGVTYSDTLYHAIYELNMGGLVETSFNYGVLYLLIILFLKRFYKLLREKDTLEDGAAWIMLAGAALMMCYAASMAAGLDIEASHAMRIATPLILCEIFSAGRKKDIIINIFKSIIVIWCMILCTVVIATKSVNAYPWWGCYNEPKENKIYTVDDVKALKGIRFTARDKEIYEIIPKLILENSNEDDIIFGYPYLKIFNILCNRYNSNFVPVIWFDVVGDKYVEMTIKEFQKKLPEIVVWMDIPGAIEAHEAIYRDGKPLVQRKLVDFFSEMLPQKYKLLGRVSGYSVYRIRDN